MGAGMLVLTKPLVIDDRAVEECAHPGACDRGPEVRGGPQRRGVPGHGASQASQAAERERERGGSETALDKRVAE